MVQLGFSIYIGTGKKKNLEVIYKAAKTGMKVAFTSLHIPEESNIDLLSQTMDILAACKDAGIEVMADVGPRTIAKLGLKSIHELKDFDIRYLRIDYGFSIDETIQLSKIFNVVFNSSTLSPREIVLLREAGADFTKFAACHNFYPKPKTGLTLAKVAKVNESLSGLQITNMAFVPGDEIRRGPLHEGLPTVEEHRVMPVLVAALQLITQTSTDIVLIGDIDVKNKTWEQLSDLAKGIVRLRVILLPMYRHLAGTVHHDRTDSSEYVIRSVESRMYASAGKSIAAIGTSKINAGDILMSNELYKRYSGELEIARCTMDGSPKINVIGRVLEDDLVYLPYIHEGMGFLLEVIE